MISEISKYCIQYRPLCASCAAPWTEKGIKIVHSPFADGRISSIKLKCKNQMVHPPEGQTENKEEKKEDDAAASAETSAANECPWTGAVQDWQSHNDSECALTVIECPHCHSVRCSKSVMDHHDRVCPEKSVICPQECGLNILRKNTQRHIDEDCLRTVLQCGNTECDQRIDREFLEHHQNEQCDKRIVSCPFRKFGCP